METLESTPSSLVVDMKKETRSLYLTPELQAALPDLVPAFINTDHQYFRNPLEYLRTMHDSIFTFRSKSIGWGEVSCSLLYNDSSRDDEILVMFAPFSDSPPRSSAETIYNYTNLENPSLLDKQSAKPNTWSQITKSGTIFELLAAMERGMPVLTIFSPVPPRAYSPIDRAKFFRGDFSPASKVAAEALIRAQDILHGPHGETRLSKIHTQGGSLGASNAIGAASELSSGNNYEVLTVTAQEWILDKNPLALIDGYIARGLVDEPSTENPESNGKIREPALRRLIDAHGNELTIFPRMLNAMSKAAYLVGLSFKKKAVGEVETLLDRGVPVTVALAENSRITSKTASHLPVGEKDLSLIKIKASEGQKVGHLADEHVALYSTVAALGIARSKKN